jgi:hypothetical protein
VRSYEDAYDDGVEEAMRELFSSLADLLKPGKKQQFINEPCCLSEEALSGFAKRIVRHANVGARVSAHKEVSVA